MKLQYPQTVFAKTIIKEIKSSVLTRKYTIIDIPCGNGETAYQFSKLDNVLVKGYDISFDYIQNAKKNYKKSNLEFEQGDIFSILKKQTNVDVLCIINSFFLLPNRDLLLDTINKLLVDDGKVFFIIPNIYSKNYMNFKKHNPDVNQVELSITEFEQKLLEHGIKSIFKKNICYTNIYGRKELKYFSRLAPLYLLSLNSIMSMFKIGTPSYYLYVGQIAKK